MKGKGKLVLGFLVGFIFGVVAASVLVGLNARRTMARQASTQLMEMAMNADLIRSGRSEVLLGLYDDAIPRMALPFVTHHRTFLTNENAALWSVQMYYERHPSVPVPAELQSILDALPPRPPGCTLGP